MSGKTQPQIHRTLVIIKPDGLKKSLTGNILTRLAEAKLRIIGAKVVCVSRELAVGHYAHLQDKPFFEEVLKYICGELHGEQYREAPRWAERALEADESAQNCNNYGIALLQEGRPKEARDVLLRALELEPDLPGALYNLAIVERFYFFDDEAALGWYRRYATHSSHDPDKLAEIFGQSPSAPLSVTGGSQ